MVIQTPFAGAWPPATHPHPSECELTSRKVSCGYCELPLITYYIAIADRELPFRFRCGS